MILVSSLTAINAFCNTGLSSMQDCKNMTALENEALIVVTNWASKNTSKYTKELEFLSCCLLTVNE